MRIPSTSANVTVFLLFFGLSLLTALQSGAWLTVLFWVAMAAVLLAIDARGRRRR